MRDYLFRLTNKPLLAILFLGILLRIFFLIISPFGGTHTDTLRFRDWAIISHTKGFAATYNVSNIGFGQLPDNTPPGSLYIVTGAYEGSLMINRIAIKLFHLQEGVSPILNNIIPLMILKIPAILSDIASAVLIYFILKHFTKKRQAILGTILYFFNPIVIYNSTIWGQIDAIYTCFFLASILLLLKKRYFLSVLFAFLSLFVKLTILPILPFYAFILLREMGIKRLVIETFLSLGILCLLTLPISTNPIQWLFWLAVSTPQGEVPFITVQAYNFWWAIFGFFASVRTNSSQLFLSLPLSVWGYVLFGVSTLPFLPFFVKKHCLKQPKLVIFFFTMIWLAAFLFLPRMHERYLYPFFPLFSLAIPLLNRFYRTYVVITAIHLLNLYYSWNPFPLPVLEIIHHPLTLWILSILLLVVSGYLYKKTFQILTATDNGVDR